MNKYKTAIIALAVLIFSATTIALVHSSYRLPHGVMLSLVGYTNDAWLHSAMYNESTANNSRIAIFAVTNETSRHTVLYWRGSVQVRTPPGWEEDVRTLVGNEEMAAPVGPRRREIIKFPVPDGSGRWRCSVRLLDVSYSTGLRPQWQLRFINLLRRAGVNLERPYLVWSPELTR